MSTKKEKVQISERRIDEALEESFSASDPPFFIGAGALQPNDNESVTKNNRGQKAAA